MVYKENDLEVKKFGFFFLCSLTNTFVLAVVIFFIANTEDARDYIEEDTLDNIIQRFNRNF